VQTLSLLSSQHQDAHAQTGPPTSQQQQYLTPAATRASDLGQPVVMPAAATAPAMAGSMFAGMLLLSPVTPPPSAVAAADDHVQRAPWPTPGAGEGGSLFNGMSMPSVSAEALSPVQQPRAALLTPPAKAATDLGASPLFTGMSVAGASAVQPAVFTPPPPADAEASEGQPHADNDADHGMQPLFAGAALGGIISGQPQSGGWQPSAVPPPTPPPAVMPPAAPLVSTPGPSSDEPCFRPPVHELPQPLFAGLAVGDGVPSTPPAMHVANLTLPDTHEVLASVPQAVDVPPVPHGNGHVPDAPPDAHTLDVSEVEADTEVLHRRLAPSGAAAHAEVASALDAPAGELTYADALSVAHSAGVEHLGNAAEALRAAEAQERSALAQRREAATAAAAAAQQLEALQEQQQSLCAAEDWAEADALNSAINDAAAHAQRAERALLAAGQDVTAAAVCVLAAAEQEAAAWGDALAQLDANPAAQALRLQAQREALELRVSRARELRGALHVTARGLQAERARLRTALADTEARLLEVDAQLSAADDGVQQLEHAHARVAEQQAAASGGGELQPDSASSHDAAALAERLRPIAAQRSTCLVVRQRAVAILTRLAGAEAAAANAAGVATERESATAREASLAVAAQAGVQLALNAAREAAGAAARQLAAVEEQKALAAASKMFKEAAQLAAMAKTLAAEREAADSNAALFAARLAQSAEAAKLAAAELGAAREELAACARGVALARWRRLRAEATVRATRQRVVRPHSTDASCPQVGGLAVAAAQHSSPAVDVSVLRAQLQASQADAAALAGQHGFRDDADDC
jgi:hypothetical protein